MIGREAYCNGLLNRRVAKAAPEVQILYHPPNIMKFEINPEYVTSVTIRTDHSLDKTEEDRVIMALKGHKHVSIRSEDHPKFAELRNELGEKGFIKIERRWWNGDTVIKPFTLNGKRFKKGEMFGCGAAMSFDLGIK